MPHLIIETTDNASDILPHDELARALHCAACSIGAFPADAIRTRLHVADHSVIGDGGDDAISVHVIVRIAKGRTVATRQRASEMLLDALTRLFDGHRETRPIAVSVEIVELDPDTRRQWHNLREMAAQRAPVRETH
ncbi:hypothetical protein C6P86_07010 [Burkholderia multivorans]|nr:5-carboxymethyl-2-hydroxymuconate isomerase family protein [Burkholderia multivorans]AOK65064.1 hypothetical protein WM33_05635 [Burkholderia multivorans]KVZ84959.1 hypothetical protein WL23_04360 [Burkholderia multivorans]PRE70501.1 hypothetical protein C6P86_07010 [Burkholderia multivorans]PRE77134.1 hypothetical protein C6Q00_27975 [Burkholderia multivorans]